MADLNKLEVAAERGLVVVPQPAFLKTKRSLTLRGGGGMGGGSVGVGGGVGVGKLGESKTTENVTLRHSFDDYEAMLLESGGSYTPDNDGSGIGGGSMSVNGRGRVGGGYIGAMSPILEVDTVSTSSSYQRSSPGSHSTLQSTAATTANGGRSDSPPPQILNRIFACITQFLLRLVNNLIETFHYCINFRCFETDEEDCPMQPQWFKQLSWCLWRAFAVRWRSSESMLGICVLVSVLGSLGLILVFTDNTVDFENSMSFLTMMPYCVVLMLTLWNASTAQRDLLVFSFERDRGYYRTFFFPLSSLLADVILYHIFPPVAISLMVYGPLLHSANLLHFVCSVCMITVVGACLNSSVCAALAIFSSFIRAASVSALILSLQLLYCGMFINLNTNRLSHSILKQMSIFYWGSNLLYWDELPNIDFPVQQQQQQQQLTTAGVGISSSTSSTLSGMEHTMKGSDILNSMHVHRIEPMTAYRVLWFQALIYCTISIALTLILHRDWHYVFKHHPEKNAAAVVLGKWGDSFLKHFLPHSR